MGYCTCHRNSQCQAPANNRRHARGCNDFGAWRGVSFRDAVSSVAA